jgi:hypothetical protein
MLDNLSGWLQVGLNVVQILLQIWPQTCRPQRKRTLRIAHTKSKKGERTIIEFTDEQS